MSTQCGDCITPLITANRIVKVCKKYERCLENNTLQILGHHSYFGQDFEMFLAVNKGELQSLNRTLGQKKQ